jgi:1,6-anhydro-N-acetylmuramate kinase
MKVIGLMSGTSGDGRWSIFAAVVTKLKVKMLACLTRPYSRSLARLRRFGQTVLRPPTTQALPLSRRQERSDG